ncbi:MAG: hypothetical protein EOM21_20205, partial [Gammaproteobacteria bacterium]|nr:hypothetical protein [Gammaproteobacteria bacterium]
MAQIANTAIPALMGRKTFADFDREAAEFEARKRERMLKEQVQGMEMQKLQKEIESGVATNDPAAVREWQFYSQLDSDTQAKYLQMKRADQIMNLGGQMAVRNPMGGLAEAYTVTPRMVDMPEFQGMQESAKTAAQQGLPYGNTPMTPAQIEAEKA